MLLPKAMLRSAKLPLDCLMCLKAIFSKTMELHRTLQLVGNF